MGYLKRDNLGKVRYELLDYLKALAVILMVVFHFCYDLNAFKFIDIQIRKDLFWKIQPKIIITLFFISVGAGLCVVHLEKIQWRKFLFRFTKLATMALLISIGTYFIFPRQWIYFGTLHNIAISSLLVLPFLRYPTVSVLVGISLIIPSAFYGYTYPFIKLGHKAFDHIELFPWLGLYLIGIFLYHKGFHRIKIPNHVGKKFILFLGKYSLEIYISHQIVLFPMVYLMRKMFNS
ncbi:MAG: putative membrane protein [Bacteriovoracaceae bacterium]